MRPLATKFVVFNAAAALVGVAALVAAAHSLLVSPTAAPCSERYHSMTPFALERGGNVLSAADLQASLSGRDVGVIENVAFRTLANAPQPVAMGVNVGRAQASAPGKPPAANGTSFPWEPRALQGKTSACLSFQVMLPADFDFNRGGALPGIAGGNPAESGDRFLALLAWRPKGLGGATIRVTENGATRSMPAETQSFELARGKWVRLEEEVVLNTPGKSDGALRVWADGALVIERANLSYRTKADVGLSGVAMDVFYGSSPEDSQAAAPKDAQIWLTALEVRWP